MPRKRLPVSNDDQSVSTALGRVSDRREDNLAVSAEGEVGPGVAELKPAHISPGAGRKPRILVSAVTPSDTPAITRFSRELSTASRRSCFFESVNDAAIAAEMKREVLPAANRHSVVAWDRDSARVVGHAIAMCDSHGSAEVALAVADEYQGHGIGTSMLDHLMQEAKMHGTRLLWADVRADNGRMLEILARAGYQLSPDRLLRFVRATITL